jgi:hypothetical protein
MALLASVPQFPQNLIENQILCVDETLQIVEIAHTSSRTVRAMQLVRFRTAQVLSIENIQTRQTGSTLKGEAVKKLTREQVASDARRMSSTLTPELK